MSRWLDLMDVLARDLARGRMTRRSLLRVVGAGLAGGVLGPQAMVLSVAAACSSPDECDDGNNCTANECNDGRCQYR